MARTPTAVLAAVLLFLCIALLPTEAGARDEEVWEVELAALIEQLAGFDAERWAEAQEEFAALGARAVPALTRSLSSSNPQVRLRAAQALQVIGPKAAPAGAELAENLLDDHQAVRSAAILALGHVDAVRAAAHLAPLLAAPRSDEDCRALWQGLAAAGEKGAPALRGELMKGPAHRRRVLGAILQLGPGAASILRALVEDESWHVQVWTIAATEALEELPATLAEAIATAGSDEREAVAVAATRRMARAVADDAWFIPPLARLVKDPRADVRRAATFGLARIPEWDSSLVVPLLSHAHDEDEGVRVNVARGLALFPPKYHEQARAALGPWLRDESPHVRIAASWSLAQLGDRSAAPAPGLIAAVAHYGGISAPFRYYLRSERAWAGGRKRFGGTVSLYAASQALSSLGPDAIPVIEAAAAHLEGHPRLMLVYVLGQMGEAAIPALERLLAGPDPLVRNVAACCLALSGAKGKAAVPHLVTLAIRQDPYDPIIVEAGDGALYEIVTEEADATDWTSWIRESHDALLAIGVPALPALRAAGTADPKVATRLAPLVKAIEASVDSRPPR